MYQRTEMSIKNMSIHTYFNAMEIIFILNNMYNVVDFYSPEHEF